MYLHLFNCIDLQLSLPLQVDIGSIFYLRYSISPSRKESAYATSKEVVELQTPGAHHTESGRLSKRPTFLMFRLESSLKFLNSASVSKILSKITHMAHILNYLSLNENDNDFKRVRKKTEVS